MNVYLRKRIQNHIKRSDMANMLGISYERYYAIEKGSVKMPLNLIDKFNEIINRGKENEITGTENKIKANEFWEQMHQKDETGRWALVNKMHEFNIKNYNELVELLGYKSVGTIYNYLEGRNPVGDEFKKRLYNFFSDETNIQIPKQETKKRNNTYKIGNKPRPANAELDKYYEKTDFKEIMKEKNITNIQIANVIGVHNSTVSNMTCKKYKPSYRVIQLVKDYLDNTMNNEVEAIKEMKEENVKEVASDETAKTYNSEYISRQKIIDECEKEIAINRTKIEELQKQINEIEAEINLSNKIMQIINNI